MAPSLYWLTHLGKVAWDKRAYIAGMFAIMLWALGIVQSLVVTGFARMAEILSSMDTEWMSTANLAVIEWVGVANAVLPLAEMSAMLVAYYSAWLSLILFRWVKSFVPTVSN